MQNLWRQCWMVLAVLVLQSAQAQTVNQTSWQMGLVLDTTASSRQLSMAQRDRGLALGHSDLSLRGPPVRFVGTTLWTDFDALTPNHATATEALRAREKACRAANFYLKKTNTTRHGQAFLAEQVREQGLTCQHWLREALAQPYDGQTVVITHFAPSLQSADPRYGMTLGFGLLALSGVWLIELDLHASDGCRGGFL